MKAKKSNMAMRALKVARTAASGLGAPRTINPSVPGLCLVDLKMVQHRDYVALESKLT